MKNLGNFSLELSSGRVRESLISFTRFNSKRDKEFVRESSESNANFDDFSFELSRSVAIENR